MNNKKAQGLPINAIILAVLALIVLVVLVVVFSGRTEKTMKKTDDQAMRSEIDAVMNSGKDLTSADKFNNAAISSGVSVRAKPIAAIESPTQTTVSKCNAQGGIVAYDIMTITTNYCICNGPCK